MVHFGEIRVTNYKITSFISLFSTQEKLMKIIVIEREISGKRKRKFQK